MPRAKTSSSATNAKSLIARRKNDKKDEWGGFVQVNLDESDKERFSLWLSENPESMWPLLVDCLAEGLKLTMVWDGANSCFIATLTGRPDSDGTVPFVTSLSARNVDFASALELLVYKHDVLLGGDWTDWLINGSKTKRNFG